MARLSEHDSDRKAVGAGRNGEGERSGGGWGGWLWQVPLTLSRQAECNYQIRSTLVPFHLEGGGVVVVV